MANDKAADILAEPHWLFHSNKTDQCKRAVQVIKEETGQVAKLTGLNPKGDIRPMVRGQVKGEDILIYSESVICLEPTSPGLQANGVPDPSIILKAVNNIPLRCYSQPQCTINFEVLHLTFELIVADVSKTIVGSDFLIHFWFAIDYSNGRLTYHPGAPHQHHATFQS